MKMTIKGIIKNPITNKQILEHVKDIVTELAMTCEMNAKTIIRSKIVITLFFDIILILLCKLLPHHFRKKLPGNHPQYLVYVQTRLLPHKRSLFPHFLQILYSS